MVGALVSESSGLDSSPGRGHRVLFLGKTLYSHRASVSTQLYNVVPANLTLGVVLRSTRTRCYTNLDKLRPDWFLGSYAELTMQYSEISV